MPCLPTPRFRGALVCLLAATGLLETGVEPSAKAASIAWQTQYESAWAEAQARQRPLWVQFTAPWCMFCRRMESEVFIQPDVATLTFDAFVPVQIRADERPDLVQAFGVAGLPATVVLGSGGEIRARHEGFLDTGRFLGLLYAARQPDWPPPAAGTTPPPEEIALAGYDVVNLVTGNGLKSGEPTLISRYDGMVFQFLDTEDRQTFERDPERYLPIYHGRCLVSLLDQGILLQGDPRFGVYYKNRLYLCASDEARQTFAADPGRYADADLADSGLCPHCRGQENRLVRGQSRYALTLQGLRYLFPDSSHLEAFRASLDRVLR